MPTGSIWCRVLPAGWAEPDAVTLAKCDLVVPVPLHRSRLWQRRYNQSAEMARRLARDWGPFFDPVLVRSRATPSQGAMASAKARRRNVQRAFQVPDPARLAGKACSCWTM